MPEYIPNVLLNFKHPSPIRNQISLHACARILNGKPQFTIQEAFAPKLSSTGILHVHRVLGSFLYYALAVEFILLLSLSDLASEQLNANTKTWDDLAWLINHAVTHPDSAITYIVNGMCLHAHNDASYISDPKVRSRAAGPFFFGDKPTQRTPPLDTALNGHIHMVYKIIKNVMGSAA